MSNRIEPSGHEAEQPVRASWRTKHAGTLMLVVFGVLLAFLFLYEKMSR